MDNVQSQQQEQIDLIMHWLRGNGEVGMFEKVRRSEDRVEQVVRDVEETKEQSKAAYELAADLRQEFRDVKVFIRGVKWAAGILIPVAIMLSGLGARWVVQQVDTILSRL